MKKKILIITSIVATLSIIFLLLYLFVFKSNEFAYSVDEEKWIEQNKNNVIDIAMPSDIPIFTMSGEGVLFDFTSFAQENIGIKINPVAYQLGTTVNSKYSIQLVDEVKDDDIKILQDEYVIIGKQEGFVDDLSKFSNLKVGILDSDKEYVQKYLPENITYVSYATKELLIQGLTKDEVNVIIGLKTLYLNDLLTNNFHIQYHCSDLIKTYVLRFNSDDKNEKSIISKELMKFKKEKLNSSYNKNLFNSYSKILNITEQELKNLNSKKYVYGYIDNGVYDNTYRRTLSGTNYFIIKSFASFANIDMKYDNEYKSLSELNQSLNSKKIDFYFDNTLYDVNSDTSKTITPIVSKIVFLTRNDSNISIKNLNSLKNKTIYTLEDSNIQNLLAEDKLNVKTFSSYKKMFKKGATTKNDVLAIELDNYEYYKTRALNDYHITYIYDQNINYGYRVLSSNELFNKLFNFYLEYTDIASIINIDYVNVYEYEGINIFLLVTTIILLIVVILQFLGKIKKAILFVFKNKNKGLSKDEKLKYIDNLTSLKNREYLNDNIEKWDNSEIYPQIIIVVDLNNISYINDNYGHEEGDRVIAQAANILIQTQLPNTEIIRTDGNEFLIYMIDYEEKKALSYIRKLNREFKNLTHGYGAAIGYSIINDAIKTIDDAVNEATLDMKTNKEIMNSEEK